MAHEFVGCEYYLPDLVCYLGAGCGRWFRCAALTWTCLWPTEWSRMRPPGTGYSLDLNLAGWAVLYVTVWPDAECSEECASA